MIIIWLILVHVIKVNINSKQLFKLFLPLYGLSKSLIDLIVVFYKLYLYLKILRKREWVFPCCSTKCIAPKFFDLLVVVFYKLYLYKNIREKGCTFPCYSIGFLAPKELKNLCQYNTIICQNIIFYLYYTILNETLTIQN